MQLLKTIDRTKTVGPNLKRNEIKGLKKIKDICLFFLLFWFRMYVCSSNKREGKPTIVE